VTATTLTTDPATNLLARANAAWATDPRPPADPPATRRRALPRRHGPAVWITSQAWGQARHSGIVVHWPTERRGPLATIEPTLVELAENLDADALLLLTDQPGVGTSPPATQLILQASPWALPRLSHPAGAMTPTIRAACWFVTATGRRAAIGRLDQLDQLLAGTGGTQVVPGAPTELFDATTVRDLAS